MCGIVVARDLTDHSVNTLVWNQFEKQINRGIEGFGAFDGKSIFKTPKLKKMRGWIRNEKHHSDFLMFHHRMPTSTINVRRAAHPFSTFDYFNTDESKVKYVLVHNGHVSNSKELKAEHEKLGITYSSTLDNGTFNDSESLLWDVALTLEGKQDNLKAYGGIAFVAAKLVDDEIVSLHFAKNPGRPLNMWREKEGVLLSSEGPGESIKDNTLYTYNYQLNRLTNKYFRVPAYKPYEYSTKDWATQPRTIPEYDYYDDHYYNQRETGLVEGIDYWTDTDGEIVYYDEDSQEALADQLSIYRASELKKKHNLAGKSDDDLTVEQYEQQWYLNSYMSTENDEVRIWEVYAEYMSQAAGFYEEAYDLMDSDLSYFADHHKTVKRDMILDLIQGAIDTLFVQPRYVDMESYDPYFAEIAAPPQKATYKQARLIGAGQEG